MKLLAWLGLADPCEMNDSSVNVATHEWLAADADARAEVSAREQLAAAQCREAAARYELRQRNRMYGMASDEIGRLRGMLAREREGRLLVERLGRAGMLPVDEQRGADEALADAMQRHPSAASFPMGGVGPAVSIDASELSSTIVGGLHVGACSAPVGATCSCPAGTARLTDAALVAKAEHLGDEIGPGREAAIEGAAITLRAHRLDPDGPRSSCSCGWGRELIRPDGPDKPGYYSGPDELARHVAEQLAAVGALGNHSLSVNGSAPVLVDEQGDEWTPAGRSELYTPPGWKTASNLSKPWTRERIERVHGRVTEKPAPHDHPVHPAPRPAVRTGSFRLGPARGLADGTE